MPAATSADIPPRMTVLLVDDSPAILTIFGELLQPHYNVRVANSGPRALEVVATDPAPDIILLDVMMPDMDGYAVLQALREDPKLRDTPVIFITAIGENENEEFGLALGAVDFINKPIRPGLLLARVKTHLALKTGRAAQQRQIESLHEDIARLIDEKIRISAAHRATLKAIASLKATLPTNALNLFAGEPAPTLGNAPGANPVEIAAPGTARFTPPA